MCLAIPGQIKKIYDQEQPLLKSADVDFDGITKRINLAYLEQARIGDYVIVHAGVAIQILDEKNALETIQYFRQLEGET